MSNRKMRTLLILLSVGVAVGGMYAAPSQTITETSRVSQQKETCKGVVKDASGETLIGASVRVKDTQKGTITDLDGNFTLPDVEPGQTLVISFMGFQAAEIVWNGTFVNVTLKEDSELLDEVVVVGFGTQKKQNLTGAVSQVKMDDVLGDRPITSTTNALQGAIPGLFVSGSGSPGVSKEFSIRGDFSINGGSPLVLIDNVEGDIDMLNPQDIESVSVMKDAAASAIYGARAAGGVILITTKRAKEGDRFTLNYNNNFGFSSSINSPVQASLDEYLRAYEAAGFSDQYYAAGASVTLWKQYLAEYKANPSAFNIVGDGIYVGEDGNVYYLNEKDVYKAFQETSFIQTHNVSASGGTERLTYRVGLGYSYEDGPLIYNRDTYKRKNLSSYLSAQITKWLKQEVDIRYNVSDRSQPRGSGDGLYAMNHISFYPSGMMPAELLGTSEDVPIGTTENQILYNNPSLTDTDEARIYLRTTITPFKGLEIVGEYTYDRENTQNQYYANNWTYTTEQMGILEAQTAGDYLYMYEGHYDHNTFNLYGTYKYSLNNEHNFSLMAGFNQERIQESYMATQAYDMVAPSAPSLESALGEVLVENYYSDYAVRGAFFRFNYDYQGKYLFEANGRYDGSSKFPKNSRFGFFPSFSAGWNIMEESWMESLKGWLGGLKIRASWGQIGNQDIDNYQYYSSMTPTGNSTYWLKDGTYVTYISTPSLVSTSFTWETVETFDVGIDLSMFNNRLTATYDWYNRTTRDMLMAGVQLPAVVGADAPMQNAADMRTKGWELSVNWRDRIGDWSYNIGFNVYDYTSKILKYTANEEKLINESYYEGMTIGEIWGYVSDGYYTIDDFESPTTWVLKDGVASISGYNPRPGDEKFVNLNDDLNTNEINSGLGTVDSPGDRKVIGNYTPRYNFGINLGVSYKNFSLTALLQGTAKRDYVLSGNALFPFGGGANAYYPVFYNQTDYWEPMGDQGGLYTENDYEYWVAKNPDAKLFRLYGQLGNSGSNTRTSTKYLQNAAYLRIKNITASYTFPKTLISKVNLNDLKLFVSVENLATFTALPKGYDPERLSWGYPFYRTISFGLNVTL